MVELHYTELVHVHHYNYDLWHAQYCYSGNAPLCVTTKASGTWPLTGSGKPTTAASSTSSCRMQASSSAPVDSLDRNNSIDINKCRLHLLFQALKDEKKTRRSYAQLTENVMRTCLFIFIHACTFYRYHLAIIVYLHRWPATLMTSSVRDMIET